MPTKTEPIDWEWKRAKMLAAIPVPIFAPIQRPDPLACEPDPAFEAVMLEPGVQRAIKYERHGFSVRDPHNPKRKALRFAGLEVLGPCMLSCNGTVEVTTSAGLRAYCKTKKDPAHD
jgi:hypothetical protein